MPSEPFPETDLQESALKDDGDPTPHTDDPDDLDRVENIEAAIEHIEAAEEDVNGWSAPTISSMLTAAVRKIERAQEMLEA